MSIGDLPTFVDAGHSHTTYGLGNLGSALSSITGTTTSSPFITNNLATAVPDLRGRVTAMAQQASQRNVSERKAEESKVSRRLVQVFIADPDENVPLEQSMLYTGEQKLTDATDQELFFEIDLKSALEKHNEARVKIINKKVKDRTEYLEPARIRDLKMIVTTVATF